MTDKFQNKYRIPSARPVRHDYNGGDYFITICTSGREHYFGEIVNGEMILNDLGMKLNELIVEIPSHHPYAQIPVYLVMPNHVHLIVCIDGTDTDCSDLACRDVACRVSTTTTTTTTTTTPPPTNNKLNKEMQEIADQCGLLSIAMGGNTVTSSVCPNTCLSGNAQPCAFDCLY